MIASRLPRPLLRALLFLVACGAASAANAHDAIVPAPRSGDDWWMKRHASIAERMGQGDVDVLFVGDSITQGWEGAGSAVWQRYFGSRKVANFGISGDRTQHVLWRIDHSDLERIAPQVCVVMIGTNNSNGEDNTVGEIAEGVTAVVAGLRRVLPDARVLLLDIFPRGAAPNPQRGKILQVNQILHRLADGETIFTLDIGHRFLAADGSLSPELMPDALHLSEAGYEIWADAIEPRLAELLAKGPLPPRHSFLVVGHGRPAAIIAEDGAVVWSHPARASDGSVLPNGNVLLALYPSEAFPHGGMVEVNRASEVVFQWQATQNEVSTAVRLPSGNTLINESGPQPRLLEIAPDGSIVAQTPLACQTENFHMQTRMARVLPDGHFLVPHLFDFAVMEYDRTGKVLRTIPTDQRGRDVHDWPFTAIRLDDGNTLIGCTHGNRVIEVDPAGQVIWQLTNDDLGSDLIRDACGIQRLANGNTVITSYAAQDGVKLFEVTRDKHVVWTWRDDGPAGVHHFQILTTNGRPIEGPPLR